MQFIDLAAQQKRIGDQINRNIQKVLAHGQYIMGPEIAELEKNLAKFTGAKHAITVSSGTDALMIALMALGIKPGDEIITPAFSFFAAAEIIVLMGAVPVFVDIDPKTYNVNPDLIEGLITPKTKALIPVSLYGQCPDMDRIIAIGRKHKIPVIEDAAQSFGASYKGKRSCSMADISVTSFFPAKPLGCYGDGGACFTDNDDWAKAMQEIRVHGQPQRYTHTRIGVNGRFDTLQAAIMLPKLEIFPEEIEMRQKAAHKYDEALKGVVQTPYVESHNVSVYAQYTVRIPNRKTVQDRLTAKGIPTAIHYPIPISEQPVLKGVYPQRDPLKHTIAAAAEVMSLPFHPYISDADIAQVAAALKESL